MTYRLGDVSTAAGPLRLTVAGLAELSERFNAKSPAELAQKIRGLSPDGARHLLTALLRPSGSEAEVARLTDTQVAALMPPAARCIAGSLA